MRIIITGTGGRLGAAVARFLRDRHRVVAWDRKALDLSQPEQIRDHFGAVRYDVVIHCAAVTLVDYCEQHPEEARAVNTDAPALIAELCRERGARMIHVSTDYVYDGRQPGPRVESDPVAPLGVYARTKADAEAAVLAVSPDFVVARTSWVFGPDRPGFVDQVIEKARRESTVAAIADKWSNPSYAADVAAYLEALALNPEAHGPVNLCNSGGGCTWLEFGQASLDLAAQAGVKLKCRTLSPLKLAEMSAFLAPRPIHTASDTTRLAALTGLPIRHWREALADYIGTYYCGRTG
jgi:dTDP-4-dehydrorhamnose reductase